MKKFFLGLAIVLFVIVFVLVGLAFIGYGTNRFDESGIRPGILVGKQTLIISPSAKIGSTEGTRVQGGGIHAGK